jgi:hypothetical protein
MTRDLYKAVNQVQPSGQYWSVTIGDTMEVFGHFRIMVC